ncbi:MAG: ATP-dependent helicase [Bdellovibrio sp. CG10_big_fil_rev_8_21_14_0_10_47_8]|nr:MAG: ATP-dependent helicase [Bdellovibrio sp. CG10_big_fil_rev_8_21_14_0_10_47_8]
MKFQQTELQQQSFQEMNLAGKALAAIEKMGILTPTLIQSQAIPLIQQGHDAVVVAQTGSGKTLAYALPIVTNLIRQTETRALILVPSREVAGQIYKVFNELLEGSSMKVSLIVGGIPNKEQVSQLKKKPRVIVATPGRMNDHLLTNKLLLQGVSTVVIDEADRMLDMGFSPQIDNIRKTMRGNWQTLMFSASFGSSVENIAQKIMRENPYLLRSERAEMPVLQLRQKVFFVDRGMKNDRLALELKSIDGGVIIFAGNQPSCESIGFHLKENGFSSDFIHGGLSPGHRSRVLREFREKKIQIMITTDLLARGLDVPHIECVINYDLPSEPEDFLHRIGRTARAGRKGKAMTFVTPRDADMYKQIKPYLLDAEKIQLN